MGTAAAKIDNGNLVIRRANRTELKVVLKVLSEAATWQAAEREAVWPVPFPSATVQASMDRHETYVLCRRNAVIGTVALCWDDPVWEEQLPDSGYVHRLAVQRHASGERLGATMLAWADRQIADAGRTWLRLDCPASNRRLRTYYEHLGFQLVREVEVTSPPQFGASVSWRLALNQRRVSAAGLP
jgi:ribosomal protein S18 acetylase RimI-like enzyme